MYQRAFSVAEFEQKCGELSPSEWFESIEPLFDCIEPARGKPCVPVLGVTGAGKSTFINYILGHALEMYYGDDGFPAVRIQKAIPGEKLAGIGKNVLVSETLYPDFFPLKTGYVLCDCPGFNDTRSNSKGLTAFLGPQLVMLLSSGVSAIIVVVSYSEILAGKAEFLRELCSDLSYFLKDPISVFRSVLFVITKAPKSYQPTHFLALITEISKSCQGLGPASFFANPDAHQSIFQLNNIVVLDVLDQGMSCHTILDRLASVPFIHKSSFSFQNYGSRQGHFFRIIDRFMNYTTELISERSKLTQETAALRYEVAFLKRQYEEFKNKKELQEKLKQCRAEALSVECKYVPIRLQSDAIYARKNKQADPPNLNQKEIAQLNKNIEYLEQAAWRTQEEIKTLKQKETTLNQKILESSEAGIGEAFTGELLRRQRRIEELEQLLKQNCDQQKLIEDLFSALQPSIVSLYRLLDGIDLHFSCSESFLSAVNRLPLHFLSTEPYVSKEKCIVGMR